MSADTLFPRHGSPLLPAGSSHLPLNAQILFVGEASRYVFLSHLFLADPTLQKNTLGQKYLRLQNGPPLHLRRGSKPYAAVPRHPSPAWRGWGEQGVHVINIKSLSATNRRRILYIFDPYTQEHNIHRTPRRSGGFARGFREMLLPCQPPLPRASPPRRRGLYRQHISHQKSRRAGNASFEPRVDGAASSPPCPGEDGEKERGQARGALSRTHKVLGVSGPWERSEALRETSCPAALGGRIFRPGGSLIRHFHPGVGVNGVGKEKGADAAAQVVGG